MNDRVARRARCGLWAVLLAVLLSACGGVPLRSVPRLMNLQRDLLQADPAEFMLAVQVDERLLPRPAGVPTLNIGIKPREPGAFEPVERKLPMRLIAAQALAGLPRAGSGRHWLVYSLTPASAAELARIQAGFREQQQRGQGAGGTFGVGIAQEGIAADDPRLARMAWQSWLQTTAAGGFFELWSGTLGELKEQAAAAQRPKSAR